MSTSSGEPRPVSLGGLRRHCLFAVTILLVEDSRSASEAIRLFATESGARVRRADSLHSASRHLAIYRPNVVIVDLGLPDGDGMALIRHLASASTPISGIIGLSGHDRDAWQDEARAAGAATCLQKPIESLASFQECILSVLSDADSRRGPDQRTVDFSDRASMRIALNEDMLRAQALLNEAMKENDAETIAYCSQFLASIGEMLDDPELARTAKSAVTDAASASALMLLLAARIHNEPPEVRGVA